MTLVFADRARGEGRGYWHQMGTKSDDVDETATAIAKRAGLDYSLTKRPLRTSNSKGHIVMVPNQFAVMSDLDGADDIIAIVGKEFEPIQNMRLAELLDRSGLVGPNGLYSMDVAGGTTDGRTVFWALKGRDSYQINGDEYRDNWIIADGKDGNRALTMALSPVRFICSNALAMAVAGASLRIGIQHTRAADAELGWWLGIAPKLHELSIKSRATLMRLGTIHVTAKQVTKLLDATYPKPKVRGRAQLYAALPELQLDTDTAATIESAMGGTTAEGMRVLAKQTMVRELFESYADTADERNIAGTALGFINAVADVENHRAPGKTNENAGLSNMFGPRYVAQANAIKATLAMAR